MKNLRQELIDFAAWYHVNSKHNSNSTYDEDVDEYLKIINSNEPDEFQAIGNNENTQEKCDHLCKEIGADGRLYCKCGKSFVMA